MNSPPDPPPTPVFHTVTAKVAEGAGRISPSGEVRVAAGASQTFSFLPDAGWAVAWVAIDGVRLGWTPASYELAGVRGAHTIEVGFAPAATPAPGSDGPWVLPTGGADGVGFGGWLRSLSSTGDNSVAPVGLAVLAATAFIVVAVSRRRYER